MPKASGNGLCSRIADCQVPKSRCLSPDAHSLNVRIAGRQVARPGKSHKQICRAAAKGCLDFHLQLHNNDSTIISAQKSLSGVHAQVSFTFSFSLVYVCTLADRDTALGEGVAATHHRPYGGCRRSRVSVKTDHSEVVAA